MSIIVQSIDDGGDTSIEISCHRETSRLDRVLTAFQKAMTLAMADGKHGQLKSALKKLHDSKGDLTAVWASAEACMSLRRYVEAAWQDECEWHVVHKTSKGSFIVETEL